MALSGQAILVEHATIITIPMFNPKSSIPQWVADLREGRMRNANEAALNFWRMTREQFLSSEFHEFIHPDEMPRWRKYISTETWGESGPWKCIRGDGSIFFCTTRWQMIEYEGTLCAFVFPLRAGDSTTTMVEVKPDRSAI